MIHNIINVFWISLWPPCTASVIYNLNCLVPFQWINQLNIYDILHQHPPMIHSNCLSYLKSGTQLHVYCLTKKLFSKNFIIWCENNKLWKFIKTFYFALYFLMFNTLTLYLLNSIHNLMELTIEHAQIIVCFYVNCYSLYHSN